MVARNFLYNVDCYHYSALFFFNIEERTVAFKTLFFNPIAVMVVSGALT